MYTNWVFISCLVYNYFPVASPLPSSPDHASRPIPSTPYKAIGVASVKLTGVPVNLTHTVYGSFPTCSVVNPCVLVGFAFVGNVTGTSAEHLFPFAVTVMPVIFALA
jgi:hypothetical protein